MYKKRNININFLFIKIRGDENNLYIKIGPIIFTGTETVEEVKIGNWFLFKIRIDEDNSHIKIGPITITDNNIENEFKRSPACIQDGLEKVQHDENVTLEGGAWVAFFILLGCIFLYNAAFHGKTTGMIPIGVGIIWLSLNYTRVRKHIEPSNFTIALGIIAIIWGLTERFINGVDFMTLVLGVILNAVDFIAFLILGFLIVLIIYFGRKNYSRK
jgi:hypothetical protein